MTKRANKKMTFKAKPPVSGSRKLVGARRQKKLGRRKAEVQYGQGPGQSTLNKVERQIANINQRDAKDEKNIAIAGEATKVSNIVTVNVCVVVNPHILAQYVWGIIGKGLAESGRDRDLNACLNFFNNVMINFEDTESLFWTSAPLAIIKLRKALEPRRIGKFYYSADFGALRLCLAAWNSVAVGGTLNAIDAQIWGFNVQAVTGSPDANGFCVPQTAKVALTTDTQSSMAQYSSILQFRAYDSVSEDYTDASAFSFSMERPVDLSNTPSTNYTKSESVMFCAGYTNTGLQMMYLNQIGSCCLEKPIRRPWLAVLRIGTPAPLYANNAILTTSAQASYVPNSLSYRNPKFTIRASAPPSLYGWNSGGRVRMPGDLQLKPVPTSRMLQALVDRLESVGEQVGTAWTNLASSDIKLYAWLLYRAYAAKYSGAYSGVVFWSPSSTSFPATPEYHCGMTDILGLKAPQPVLRLLGASLPVVGETTLIPLLFAPSLSTITTRLTYAGTPIVFPATECGQANYYSAAVKIITLRPLERFMANCVNMGSASDLGPSFLDTSLGIGAGSSGVLRISSRRRLSDDLLAAVLSNAPAIGYYRVADNLGTGANQVGVVFVSGNQTYCEDHVKELSGSISITNLTDSTWYEGLVTSGFTSNIAENTGTGRDVPPPYEEYSEDFSHPIDPPRLTQSLQEVPPVVENAVLSYAKKLVPRSGKYCGPGWTAGVDTSEKKTFVDAKGQYVVRPTSAEDAICKVHDEAYRVADGDRVGIEKADQAMVRALDVLAGAKGLSLYGHAARIAIRIKLSSSRRFQDVSPQELASEFSRL